MKLLRIWFSIICVVILLATPVSVFAIGFKAEEKYNSVFVVTSGNALGSGFAVGENCVVTNAHVLGDNNIYLTTYSGETHLAYLVGCDQEKDIAILGVKGAKFTPLEFADYEALNIGDDVYAIGAPKSMAYTLTKGVISAKERKIGEYTYIQTDAAINEGNSGGPLINEDGDVIGVNTLKMSNSEGIGLAIPMTEISEFIESLNIEQDENGNIKNTIEQDKKNNNNSASSIDSASDNNHEKTDKPDEEVYHGLSILVLFLCVSVVINIVLIISLIFPKKKNITMRYDPRERTDFDIEILE